MTSSRRFLALSGLWLLLAVQVGCGAGADPADTAMETSASGSADGDSGGAGSGATGSGGAGSGATGSGAATGTGGSGGIDFGSGGFGAGGYGTGGVWLGGGGARDPGCAPEGEPASPSSGGSAGESLMERLVPYQNWPKSGPTVTGILYVNQSESYGPVIDHLRGVTPSGSVPLYGFATDGSSPFWLYFLSNGEGEGFRQDRDVMVGDRQVVQLASARFGPQTQNPWGLEQDAYIVTLEVNNQLGSVGGLQGPFVATDVTIVSGTAEIPMNPSQTMAAAAELFDAELQSLQTEIDALLGAALEKTNPTCGTLAENKVVGVWPNWQTEDKILSLTFVHQHQRIWAYEWLIWPGTSGTPPQYGYATHGHVVEYATRYDYDAAGTLLMATTEGPLVTDYPLTSQYR